MYQIYNLVHAQTVNMDNPRGVRKMAKGWTRFEKCARLLRSGARFQSYLQAELPHVESIFQQVMFVYEPEGIDGSAKTNFTPGLAKSAMEVMPFGLPCASMTSRLLVVKFT